MRNGDSRSPAMYNLAYHYVAGTNQLHQVTDAVITPTPADYNDIKTQSPGNYRYDKIGNLISDISEGISNIAWTVYSKINTIAKTNGSVIKYTYDASGNRNSKIVTTATTGDSTYYVRDASGNVMSVYNKKGALALAQTELHLYGSSRLGVYNVDVDVENCLNTTNSITTFTRGNKFFELSNHLGNVLATLSDKKLQVSLDGIFVGYYLADVVTAGDYYPFGMAMPLERKYSQGSNGYRYGFNGKENDNEVKGNGNQQDYGMRIYDTRLGRFLKVDPLDKQYPYYSPYHYAGNSPIAAVDIDGLEPKGYAYVNNNPNNYSFKKYDCYGVASYTVEGVGKINGTLYKIQDAIGDNYWALESTTIENYIDPITGKTQSAVKKESFYFTKPPSSSIEAYKEGRWLPYETTSQEQARLGSESANMLGKFWFGVATIGTTVPAIIGGISTLTPAAVSLYGTYGGTIANITNNYILPLFDESGQAGNVSAIMETAVSKLAFGFEQQARGLASKIGGIHMMDFKGDWKGEFFNRINNAKNELHFSLNDFEGSVMSNILNPGRSNTNWELNTLYQNKDAFERTIFYVGDKTYTGSEVFNVQTK